MKPLRQATIVQFEREQAEHGTRVALENFLWGLAADLMRAAGVTRIRTTYAKAKGRRRDDVVFG